jgi:hypothetical protein
MTTLTTLGIASLLFVAWFTARAYRNDTPTGAGQSRRQSIIEAWANIAIGFSINFAANLVLLPLLDSCTTPTAWQNFMLGWVYTAISIIRQFAIRRWFNDRITAAARRIAGNGA